MNRVHYLILSAAISLQAFFIISSFLLPAGRIKLILYAGLAGGFGLLLFLKSVQHPKIIIAILFIGTGLDLFGRIPGMPIPITIFHLSAMAIFIIYILRGILNQHFNLYIHPFFNTLFIFLVYVAVSLFYSDNFLSGVIDYARLLFLCGLSLIASQLVFQARDFKFYTTALIVVGLFVAFYTFVQLINPNALIATHYVSAGSQKLLRVSGTFHDPNWMALFYNIVLIIISSVIIHSDYTKIKKVVLALALIPIFISLLISFSRSGWLGCIVGLAFVFWQPGGKKYILPTLLIIVIITTSLIYFFDFENAILIRFQSIFETQQDYSNANRIFIWKSGLEMFSQSFWFGHGLRSFPTIYHTLRDPIMPTDLYPVVEPHNLYVSMLAELGIIGLAIMIALIYQIYVFCAKTIATINDPFLRSIQIGFAGSLLTYAFFSIFFADYLNNIVWIIIGMIFIIPQLENLSPQCVQE